MLRISIEVENEAQFDRTFTRFTEQLRDLRDLWPGVIPELRQAMDEQFGGEGVGASGKWAALNPAYAAWKSKRYPGKPILQRTGRLVESLTGNRADSIVDAKPDYLEFGTRVPYAIHHHRGTGRLKKRKVIDLNEEQKTRIMKAIQRRLLSAGRESGFALE